MVKKDKLAAAKPCSKVKKNAWKPSPWQCCQLSRFPAKSGGFQRSSDGKFSHLAASGKSRGFDNFYGGNLADFKKITVLLGTKMEQCSDFALTVLSLIIG